MKQTLLALLEYTKVIFSKTILWLFLALDAIGLAVQYAPLIVKQSQPINLPPLIFVGLAVIGFYWAGFQVYRETKKIGATDNSEVNSDIKLLQKFTEVLPSTGTIAYIRDHDFGGSIELDRMMNLDEFIEICKFPEFEFLNIDLEKLKLELLENAARFSHRLDEETFPLPNPSLNLNRIPKEMATVDPNRYRVLSKELNGLAQNVVTTYDNLIRLARRKLQN